MLAEPCSTLLVAQQDGTIFRKRINPRSDFSLKPHFRAKVPFVLFNVIVRNMLICRKDPVDYREDVARKNAWHEEVGTVGLNHAMVSRLTQRYLRWFR